MSQIELLLSSQLSVDRGVHASSDLVPEQSSPGADCQPHTQLAFKYITLGKKVEIWGKKYRQFHSGCQDNCGRQLQVDL